MIRKKIILYAMSLLSLLIYSGCYSPQIDKSIVNDTRPAKTAMGPGGQFYSLQIPSQGPVNDTVVGVFNTILGPSTLVRQLAETMAKGQYEQIRLAVTGFSAEKTKQAILLAVKLNKGNSLKHLKFMYVGYPKYRAEIQTAIESLDAQFFFRSILAPLLKES